jgi:hypothetical protein
MEAVGRLYRLARADYVDSGENPGHIPHCTLESFIEILILKFSVAHELGCNFNHGDVCLTPGVIPARTVLSFLLVPPIKGAEPVANRYANDGRPARGEHLSNISHDGRSPWRLPLASGGMAPHVLQDLVVFEHSTRTVSHRTEVCVYEGEHIAFSAETSDAY